MLRIETVVPGSYAADLELNSGDQLLTINQLEINDLIDYYRTVGASWLAFEVLRQDGEIWDLEIEKDPAEDIGLVLEHPLPLQCGNNCLFCFVHQLPKGMRRSLYVKDEDYRFSYLYGSYITLSNLLEKDLQRIVEQQLSPLYISVHSTEEHLRERLLGRATPPLMPLLKRLVEGGIELHCQIVLCPGINDGAALQQSIEQLAALYPRLASLAVVPVGLTQHRLNLPRLRPLTCSEAKNTLALIQQLQEGYLTEKGSRFVFAADEIYLQAGAEIPALAEYENLSQLENGVGLIAQFRQQAEEVLLEADSLDLSAVTLVTGISFANELKRLTERLAVRTGVKLMVVPINNHYFGPDISVTGLLTGTDLLQQLQDKDLGQGVLISEVMLAEGGQKLLDDWTLEDLQEQLNAPVVQIENSPWGILEGLEKLAVGPVVIHCD